MVAFFCVFLCNTIVLVLLMRWRGLSSAEGLAMAFVTLMVVSDGVSLFLLALFDPSGSAYAIGRMNAEVVPTLIHILGLSCFAIGLALVDPAPRRPERAISDSERAALGTAGWALAALGLGMKVAALYLWGVRSLRDYLDNLYLYDFKARSYSFLDHGVALAVMGFALIAIASEGHRTRQALALGAGLATAMVLSLSKSGVFLLILPFYLLARTFSPASLRTWSRAPTLAAVAVIFMVGLGLKAQVKYRGVNLVQVSSSKVLLAAVSTVGHRFSAEGLYRKYSYLVSRIAADPTKALHGVASTGIFAAVVPRFVWRGLLGTDKPPHPFYARGALVNEDYHIDLYANDAPSFVGAAYADAGLVSLIPTMVLGGIFFGLIGCVWRAPARSAPAVVGYLFFASQAGPAAAESGFLNTLYFAVWGLVVGSILWSIIWCARKLANASLPGHRALALTPESGS